MANTYSSYYVDNSMYMLSNHTNPILLEYMLYNDKPNLYVSGYIYINILSDRLSDISGVWW